MTSTLGNTPSESSSAPRRDRVPFSQSKRDFLVMLASTVLALMGGMVNGMLTARLLGVHGRGELAAIQNPVQFISYVALAALPAGLAYFAAKEPARARSIATTVSGLFLVFALPLCLVTYFVLPSVLKGEASALLPATRLYLLFTVPQGLVLVASAGLQALGRFGLVGAVRLLPTAFSIGAVLLAWGLGHPDGPTVSRFYLIGYLAIVFMSALFFTRASRGSWAFDGSRVKPILGYVLPSALALPVGSLNLQLDQLLMASLLPTADLGLYAVSASWSSLTAPAFSALGSVLFPKLAAMGSPEAQRAVVGRSLRLGTLLALVLFAGHLLVTPLFLPLLYGRAFTPALPTACILVGAAVSLNLAGLTGEILRGLGHPRWVLYSQGAALPVTALALFVFLPRFGIVGGGVASLLAYTVTFVVGLIGLRQAVAGLPLRELIPRAADARELWEHGMSLVRRLRP